MDRFLGDGSMFGKFGGVVIVILSAAIIAGLILRPSPDELPAAMSLGVTPATSSQLEPVTPMDEAAVTEAVTETPTESETTDEATPTVEAVDATKDIDSTEATETPATDVDATTEEDADTAAEEKAVEPEAETTDAPTSEDKPAQ